MAAARDDGAKCGVGAAFRAQLSAIAILQFGEISDADEARALSFRTDINDIYSNSWGPTDDGNRKEGPKPLTAAAMEHSIRNGRGGLGSVYMWSSGNGRRSGDTCNYDGYANWRYTITVGAVDYQGIQAWYSESCSAIHFVAPSSGSGGVPAGYQFVISSDLLGSHGLEQTDCNMRFSGTSAACPLAAGIVALVLQARPDLNWIELQQVLIDSVTKNNPTDGDWAQNSAGRWFSNKYGFGLINATQAVLNAESFTQRISLNESVAIAEITPKAAFANSANGYGTTSSVPILETFSVRHAEVYVTITTTGSIGMLRLIITAPSGTATLLAEKHNDAQKRYNNWRFTSLKTWGEKSNGAWTLSVVDVMGSHPAELVSWKLVLYGGETSAASPISRPVPPPRPVLLPPEAAPALPAPINMTSGVARSVQSNRVLLFVVSALPLVLLAVWAGSSRFSGKRAPVVAVSVGVTLFVLFATVAFTMGDGIST